MNKRIAMIAYTQLPYDSRVIREASAAIDCGFQVDFYTLKQPRDAEIPGVTMINSSFDQYKGSNKLAFIYTYLRFFTFILLKISINHFKNPYAVIHVNNMPNFLVFGCLLPKLFGAKIILDIHDLMPELYAEKFHLPLNHFLIRLLYLEERMSGRFANVVIATNRLQVERFHENKIKKKEYPIILNASDEEVFKPFTDHNFHQEQFNLIFPSTLAKRLGLDLLVEAMKIVSEHRQNIVLHIYGDGEYKDGLVELIQDKNLNGQVKFHGVVDHPSLSKAYEKAHVGVVPWPSNYSTNYQMPIKMNEYFIKGLAAITSDVRIIKEYFSDCTLFYQAGNAKDFAEKILYLEDNRQLAKDLATKGHTFYLDNSWSKYKLRYQQLITQLAGKPN